ncbi:hypothetical protein [Flavobacterium soli]|uniref:hypothetical protein n=1 Tax=Flavobacterium soli TaxID=344881 RepID=UPI0004247C22|nr:hypothetical protein [Flavobacterium soli]
MKNAEDHNKEENIKGIARKISEGLYINVNRIPTHHVNLEDDSKEYLKHIPDDITFERIMKDNLRNKDDDSLPDDKDQGDETIGIP